MARRMDGDAERSSELDRVSREMRRRLESLGIYLDGRESSEELVQLQEAVEEFESAVEARGGDLMSTRAFEVRRFSPMTRISHCRSGASMKPFPAFSNAWYARPISCGSITPTAKTCCGGVTDYATAIWSDSNVNASRNTRPS